MGQYYLTVNLDKGEYLNPHQFGSGLKLLEFGSDSCGVLTALAVLCADGNGRGGGDLCQNVQGKALKVKKGLRIDHSFSRKHFLTGKTEYHNTVVPEIAGRWGGDRIVVAGDYGDHGKFLTKEQIDQFKRDAPARLEKEYLTPETIRDWYQNDEAKARQRMEEQLAKIEKGEINLYEFAKEHYTDISAEAMEAICQDGYIRERYIDQYSKGDCFAPDRIPTFLKDEVAKYKSAQKRKAKKEAVEQAKAVGLNYGAEVKYYKNKVATAEPETVTYLIEETRERAKATANEAKRQAILLAVFESALKEKAVAGAKAAKARKGAA